MYYKICRKHQAVSETIYVKGHQVCLYNCFEFNSSIPAGDKFQDFEVSGEKYKNKYLSKKGKKKTLSNNVHIK